MKSNLWSWVMDLAILNLIVIDPWTFEFLRKIVPFKVETDLKKWPTEMPGAYPGIPCTDGATIWIPKHFPMQVPLFLHELSHAVMHFPNGPDIRLADPWALKGKPFDSMWECEASAVASMVQMAWGEEDHSYNRMFLECYSGDEPDEKRLIKAAKKIISFSEKEVISGDQESDEQA